MTKHDAERKVKILDFIAATLRARGFPPSVREIARAVGLASTSAVHHHLQILEREGYLERGAAQSRAIRLTPTAAIRLGLTSELVPQATTGDARVVPIIGEIAAGGPIEAYQDATETMAIPDVLAPGGDAYVLRVRGDSMIEAHIADGDFVLIRPQTTARNGDIVVAQVEENAVTLKRFFKEKDQIRLQPANRGLPASVLRRRPDPGEVDRGHSQARLTAARWAADACVGRLRRSLTHLEVRSLACSPSAFASTAQRADSRFFERNGCGYPLGCPRSRERRRDMSWTESRRRAVWSGRGPVRRSVDTDIRLHAIADGVRHS